jgi:hypothetical protein
VGGGLRLIGFSGSKGLDGYRGLNGAKDLFNGVFLFIGLSSCLSPFNKLFRSMVLEIFVDWEL